MACCPQKFPIDFKIFQWKCPLENENGHALLNMKFQAWTLRFSSRNALSQALYGTQTNNKQQTGSDNYKSIRILRLREIFENQFDQLSTELQTLADAYITKKSNIIIKLIPNYMFSHVKLHCLNSALTSALIIVFKSDQIFFTKKEREHRMSHR